MSTKRAPIAYSGSGSAIDNYFSPNPIVEPAPKKQPFWGKFDQNNEQHRLIISLMYQANWTKDWKGKRVPDLARLSDFLHSEKSPVNKALMKMETKELSKIIIAFEGIVASTHQPKKANKQ